MSVQINGDTGNISATKADYSGNVTIGGTLTYEDVTNIDSVGLVTARSGIEIGVRPGVAASISVDGNMIVSGISTLGNDVSIAGNLAVDSGSNGMIDFGDITTAYGRLYADNSNGVLIGSKSNHALVLRTNNTESFRVDTGQRVLLGGTSHQEVYGTTKLQIAGTTGATSSMSLLRHGNSPYMILGSSGGSSLGDVTALSGGDRIGQVTFAGADGTDINTHAASIAAYVDGSVSSNTVNGRIVFQTGASETERLRIASDGNVLIQEGTFSDRTLGIYPKVQIEGNSASSSSASIVRNTNDINPAYLFFGKTRGTSVGGNTVLQTGDVIGSIVFHAGDGTDLNSEAAFIRTGIATGRANAVPTVGNDSTPGVLEFATTRDGDSNARKHVELDSDGIFKLMTGNTENDNNSGFDTNQNPIGFYKIQIADEANCSDILMPKPGCLILIQPYSTYPAYPQPLGSIAYVDSGASKRADVFLDPFSKLAAKTSLTTNVNNCDDDKYTVMPGNAYQTFRITNRIDNAAYTFCITMI